MACLFVQQSQIIVRLDIRRTISEFGWRLLITRAINWACDGEIVVIPFAGANSCLSFARQLVSEGFVKSGSGSSSDFFTFNGRHQKMPDWIELVDVYTLNSGIFKGDARAWKLKNSDVFQLYGFNQSSSLTKGYEIDWPPRIGKICD